MLQARHENPAQSFLEDATTWSAGRPEADARRQNLSICVTPQHTETSSCACFSQQLVKLTFTATSPGLPASIPIVPTNSVALRPSLP